jgi:hypothetical protein
MLRYASKTIDIYYIDKQRDRIEVRDWGNIRLSRYPMIFLLI